VLSKTKQEMSAWPEIGETGLPRMIPPGAFLAAVYRKSTAKASLPKLGRAANTTLTNLGYLLDINNWQ
jgi:hypothetical protein